MHTSSVSVQAAVNLSPVFVDQLPSFLHIFVQWFYNIYWNIYRFSRIIGRFYWNTKMAYASYFDTKVTELRFKCLQWTIYLHNLNNEVDFQIYEDQNNSSIDFEIILRDNEGNNAGNFIVNDIHVNDQLIEVVRHVINIHMYHFGVQVSNFL